MPDLKFQYRSDIPLKIILPRGGEGGNLIDAGQARGFEGTLQNWGGCAGQRAPVRATFCNFAITGALFL